MKKIFNCTNYDVRKLENFLAWAAKELDIVDDIDQNAVISMQSHKTRLAHKIMREGFCVYYPEGKTNQLGWVFNHYIEIYKTTDHKLLTLAHELVHVKQSVEGRLLYKQETRFWEGQPIHTSVPYEKLPWEIEANKVSWKLVIKYYWLKLLGKIK